jgi:hypothetical protein
LSAELRERILQVADELGYAGPDAAGRALARRRTGLVGVLLTSAPDEAFENLVALRLVSAIARADAALAGAGAALRPRAGRPGPRHRHRSVLLLLGAAAVSIGARRPGASRR